MATKNTHFMLLLFNLATFLAVIDYTCSFEREHFVFWPNGTIPFYINPKHFDKDQSLSILRTLTLFAYKTCLQFSPVMAEPTSHHVMLFQNPTGVRKCVLDMEGHAKEEPHRISLGYECLRTPYIEQKIMKALGFPLEHNRIIRDVYIDVQFENIEPGFVTLFTKEKTLPLELRDLPYDIHSVMHFGEREYSKNGHRSIIFKNANIQQDRNGLSETDIKKIKIIYGPECQRRDRQAKFDMCKNYPSVRRKRETDFDAVKNLRVNRDITPPPDHNVHDDITNDLKELKIEDEVQLLIEQVHKITAIALENKRTLLCNNTLKLKTDHDVNITRKSDSINSVTQSDGMLKIIEVVVNHVKESINKGVANITVFCDDTSSIDLVQRARCGWGMDGNRCPQFYKSTKSGPVRYSTQHRPFIFQSTKHDSRGFKHQYAEMYRSGNDTEKQTNGTRRKRDLTNTLNSTSNISNFTKKTNENVTTNTPVFITVKDATLNDTKEIMRMATKVFTKKSINFAPIRRSNRNRESREKDSEEQNDDSNLSLERDKNKRPKSKSSKDTVNIRIKHNKEDEFEHEREQKRPRERDRKKNKVDRPHKQKSKGKRDKQRWRLPETVPLTKQNKEFYAERIWPDGIVRYVITNDVNYNLRDMRARLEEVNDILKKNTCVRIEEVSEEEGRKHTDYLVLDASQDYVTGRVGGRQNFGSIELFEGGQHRQHAAMVVMAMLGFYFELSRHDRDRYVRVHNRHIRPDKLHHFEKIPSDATLDLPYDYASATHPAWQFWRRVGRTGISTVATYKDKDPDGSIMRALGQNKRLLSALDITKINSVYGVHCFQSQRRIIIN